jgi:GTP-binding protein HflX
LLVDVSHPAWEIHHGSVLDTLEALGAQDKPSILVFNKVDLLEHGLDNPGLRDAMALWPNAVAISAHNGLGMNSLMAAIVEQVKELLGAVRALVPYSESSLIQDCYDFGRVQKVEYQEHGIYVEAELVAELRGKLAKYAITDEH